MVRLRTLSPMDSILVILGATNSDKKCGVGPASRAGHAIKVVNDGYGDPFVRGIAQCGCFLSTATSRRDP